MMFAPAAVSPQTRWSTGASHTNLDSKCPEGFLPDIGYFKGDYLYSFVVLIVAVVATYLQLI